MTMIVNSFQPIRRDCYTMAVNTDSEIEITAYGEIVESRPYDFWTGKPIKGSFIILDEFLSDIEAAESSGAKSILLKINSLGGDAGVAITLHNRLRELARKGIAISCVVDGVAMSGGSLIMCACDNVSVNPASIVMIHKSWSMLCGGYNADELRTLAQQQDAWDKAQIEIYKRKCGLSDTVILHMLSDTTYMAGREAVEKGFADTLLEDAEPTQIVASADRKSLYVNGRKIALMHGMEAPETISVSTSDEDDIDITSSQIVDEKGGKHMANNLAELKNENAVLAAQVESDVREILAGEQQDAVEAERRRIRSIDEIAGLFDREIVNDAKYVNPCTAAEMTYRAAQHAAKAGSAFMKNMGIDNKESGVNDVHSAPADQVGEPDESEAPEAKLESARKKVREALGKKEED